MFGKKLTREQFRRFMAEHPPCLTYIRYLLVIGAITRIMGRARHKVPAESWIGRKLASKPKMLVGLALANRIARQIWAMLRKNEDYRDPTLATA